MYLLLLQICVMAGVKFFGLHITSPNVRKAVNHPPRLVIIHTALSLFRYDDYPAHCGATSLSYVIEVDVWLVEQYNFYGVCV